MSYQIIFKLYVLSILILCVVIADAQSPGGVKNPILWESTWVANSQEEHGNKTFNYNPYKFFTEDRGYTELPIKGLKKMSLFVVFSSDKPSEIGRINTGRNEVILTDTSVVSRRSIAYEKIAKPKFISYIESFPGGSHTSSDVPHFIVGSKDIKDEWYEGGIAEVIMYDRLVSRKQRRKIESYLSLKYGISLPDNSDYIRSDGVLLRDGKSHGSYIHNVTGIGRDDNGGLYQKQSSNLYSDVSLTIGMNCIDNMNKSNNSSIKNNSFLIWSDDDGKAEFKKAAQEESSFSLLERKWELTIIGDDVKKMPMSIELDANGIEGFDPSQKLYLVISDDDNADEEDELVRYEMIESKTGYLAKGVMLDNNNSGTEYLRFMQSHGGATDLENRNSIGTSDKLYPNPVEIGSKFTLELADYKDSEINITILNSTGQVVRSRTVSTKESLIYQDELKVSGAYTVSLTGEKTNVTYKLVVQQ